MIDGKARPPYSGCPKPEKCHEKGCGEYHQCAGEGSPDVERLCTNLGIIVEQLKQINPHITTHLLFALAEHVSPNSAPGKRRKAEVKIKRAVCRFLEEGE